MGRTEKTPRCCTFCTLKKRRPSCLTLLTANYSTPPPSTADYQYNMNGRGRTSGFQFQSWGTPGNGYQATDAWSSGSSALQFAGGAAAEAPRDHVCKPVIAGSEGRVMPAVLECPPRYHSNHGDGYGAGGDGRWDQGGGSYAFGRRSKPKGFFDHVQDAASSGYGLGLPGSAYPRYDAVGGAYGASAANGWGNRTGGGGWGTPLGKVTNSMEAAAESLLDSARPAAAWSAHTGGGGGGGDSWSSSRPSSTEYAFQQNKTYGSASSIDSKEAAKRYGGQFIW